MAEACDFDVVIAGSGPVGCTLALALKESPVSVARIAGEGTVADRPIALSHGSRLILERLNVWKQIPGTPIEAIHVSQRHGFGRTVMRAAEVGLPALGYVTAYSDVLAPLASRTPSVPGMLTGREPDDDGVTLRLNRGNESVRVRTRLLVLADGGRRNDEHRDAGHRSAAHTRDYRQHAIVAEVVTERPHGGVAWERFTAEGPIALLPFNDRYAMVWSVRPESAAALLALDESGFLGRLRDAFGGRLGNFESIGARAAFPLSLRYGAISPAPRTLAVGNAAQSLHPVAGQGLNLGLRDAWELAEMLIEAAADESSAAESSGDEIGRSRFLDRRFFDRYARRRRFDRYAGIGMTDFLARIFSNSLPPIAAARGAGLAMLDILPPARRFLARRMIFGARALP